MTQQSRERVLLVTGPAGAGRLTALRALEDLGFESIDNLPLDFIERVLDIPSASPLALGVDARGRNFDVGQLLLIHRALVAREDLEVGLLYLDCADDVLLRRYSETRRRHPLARETSPAEGIAQDKDLMEPIRDAADLRIDTSAMSVHDLRAELELHYAPSSGRFLALQVQSFSYKRGLPQGLDMVFDVRFLRNPHWDEALRPLTGQDPRIAAYIAEDPLYAEFYEKMQGLVELLLPAYKEEGKSYLSIGFGCTGGKHRSVALAEALSQALGAAGWHVSLRHRELEHNAARARERRPV